MSENLQEVALQVLELLGFSVSEIPESDTEKRADFRAVLPGSSWLIEAKTKHANRSFEAELSAHGRAVASEPARYRSRLANLLADANAQVAATKQNADEIGACFVVCTGDDESDREFRAFQVLSTSLGICDIVVGEWMGKRGVRVPCLFWERPALLDSPEIAVLFICWLDGDNVGLRAVQNPFSAGGERAAAHLRRDAGRVDYQIVSTEEWVASRTAFELPESLRRAGARAFEEEKVASLKSHYDLSTAHAVAFKRRRAGVVVPRSETS